MASDNEKLISLLRKMDSDPTITCPRKVSEPCDGCEFNTNDDKCDTYARKAAYLIENGVVVQPCMPGETLYLIQIDFKGNYFMTTISDVSKITMLSILRAYEEKTVVYMSTDKEQAEQKLKEMRGE